MDLTHQFRVWSHGLLVHKPNMKVTEYWRMIVDYRSVNFMTRDYPYHLRLIEHLICKYTKNCL